MSERPLRVALLSSTHFGYRCLKGGILGTPGVEVVGILTTPRAINISYSAKPVSLFTHADFHEFGLPTAEMTGEMKSPNYLQYLEPWQPDLLLVLGWYYLIPRKAREAAPLGCAGIHASLLPKYRGNAPINYAILNGETETGVTFLYLGEGVDTGDIIRQERYPITDDDTCATVYDKAVETSCQILRETLPQIAAGTAPRTVQPPEAAQTPFYPPRTPDDGLLDWTAKTAREAHNWIRAQTHPYPGAFSYLDDKKVMLWKSSLYQGAAETGLAAGTIVFPAAGVEDAFGVVCADGQVVCVHEAGVAGEDSLNGARFVGRFGAIGKRFNLTPYAR